MFKVGGFGLRLLSFHLEGFTPQPHNPINRVSPGPDSVALAVLNPVTVQPLRVPRFCLEAKKTEANKPTPRLMGRGLDLATY